MDSSVIRSEDLIAPVVLAWVIDRQLRARRLRSWPVRGIVMTGLGVIAAVVALSQHALTVSTALLLVLSLAVGGALAVARAFTTRLWDGGSGTVTRQGSWLTATLWLVG